MKYELHEHELNFIRDKALHSAITTLSSEDRRRICVAISGCADDAEIDAYAEAVIGEIESEKRYG